MLAAIGVTIVILAVISGFLLERGNLSILIQPAELIIICGATLGSFLIASPKKLAFRLMKDFFSVFIPKKDPKLIFFNILLLLFELVTYFRREGAMAVEKHVNEPKKSFIFNKYPLVRDDSDLCDFICDNLKIFIAVNIEPYEFDNLMEIDIETYQTRALVSPIALGKVADSLPGLGILAAVLGVVLTMGKLNEPPEILGHSVGAALVGTFLGVLGCYGLVGPISIHLEHLAQEKQAMLNVIKTTLTASAIGIPPAMAVESGRRAIPNEYRISFDRLERYIRSERDKADQANYSQA